MPVPADRAWQLPWLRRHLFIRNVITTPWGKDWPIVKRELARCAELRRAMTQAGCWYQEGFYYPQPIGALMRSIRVMTLGGSDRSEDEPP